MSILTETKPKPKGWLEKEISQNMKDEIGCELYQWLEAVRYRCGDCGACFKGKPKDQVCPYCDTVVYEVW